MRIKVWKKDGIKGEAMTLSLVAEVVDAVRVKCMSDGTLCIYRLYGNQLMYLAEEIEKETYDWFEVWEEK